MFIHVHSLRRQHIAVEHVWPRQDGDAAYTRPTFFQRGRFLVVLSVSNGFLFVFFCFCSCILGGGDTVIAVSMGNDLIV